MKAETMGTFIDTQDIYRALSESESNLVDGPTKAFLRHKLKKTCKEMRETAEYIEKRLKGEPGT